MSEPPGGDSFGRKASDRLPGTSSDQDGEFWPAARRSLNSDTQAARSGVKDGSLVPVTHRDLYFLGATSYAPGGPSPLVPSEWAMLDLDSMRARLLAELGFTEAEYERLGKNGPKPPELQNRWDDALLALVEDGAPPNALSRAFGWLVDSQGQPVRLRRALKRARKRREEEAR